MSGAPAPLFLGADAASDGRLRATALAVVEALERAARSGPGAAAPPTLAAAIEALDPVPELGRALETTLAEVADLVLANGVRPADPLCAAHLHPPPLAAAAAAELAIGVTNQSLDSFEQSPAATLVEDRLVRRLAELFGLGAPASGVLTAGGTASNLLGLMLARDRAHPGARAAGLPADAARSRIVASAAAHDSVARAAGVLGLGRDAVTTVPTGADGRIDVAALDATLARLAARGERPIALVATAGTTDAGALDPLHALADRARDAGAWLHVDAALGSALALSDRLRGRLDGIERADSITADLHKLWWQPIGASALLVRDGASLQGAGGESAYLNRPEDPELNLVERSLDTSRRFDALKVLVSLRTVGRARMGGLVEHCVALATQAAELVERDELLELLCPPATVCVLFRAAPAGLGAAELDALNTDVQRRLFADGRAVVGRTRHDGSVALKLTLTNPLATGADIERLLGLVTAEAIALAKVGAAA